MTSDSLGLAAAAGGHWPDTQVIFDDYDWGNRGMQGWTQLHDGPVGWYPPPGIEPLGHGGGSYLTLRNIDGMSSRERDCTAIKRWNRVVETVDKEVWWAWRAPQGSIAMRAVDFGMDTATGDGTRHFMKFRWGHITTPNRDGTGLAEITNKIQVIDYDGMPTDLPGTPTYIAPPNEQKANLNYFRGRYRLSDGKYLGCIFGSQRFGCFVSPAEQAAFEAFATGEETALPTFSNGMNCTIDTRGRIDNPAINQTVMSVQRVRLSEVV